MRVRVVTTPEELASLRDPWEEVAAHAAAGPFASFDWVTTWWQHFGAGRELLVLLAEEAEGLAAVAPLNVARYRVMGFPVRVVEFIGAPLSGRRLATCLDFAIARAHEECLAGFAQALREQAHRWELCAFHGVPAAGGQIETLAQAAGSDLVFTQTATYEVPCLDPQGRTWEEFVAGRDRSFRHWLRRTERRARDAGLEPVTRIGDAAGLRAILPELSRICAASWKAARGLGLFHDGDPTARFLADFLQRTAQWDRVLLTRTTHGGRVASYQLGFLHSGKLWFYDTAYDQAYDQAAPGFRVFSDMIRTGFGAGVTRIDLGPGLHPYKLRWTEERERRENWVGFHRGWRSRLIAGGYATARALRRRARRGRAVASGGKR